MVRCIMLEKVESTINKQHVGFVSRAAARHADLAKGCGKACAGVDVGAVYGSVRG